ncbi:MAG: hypothetical protein AAF725_23915 [Acidobacteriota bacterium]
MSEESRPARAASPRAEHALGLALFAFIPAVLYLFVAHPEPVGLSLAAGVLLMVGHRFLARPYMLRVAPRICLWSHRGLADEGDGGASEAEGVSFDLHLGKPGEAAVQRVRCLRQHRAPLARFFTFTRRFRPLVAAGIFVPLLLLITCLGCAGFGLTPPLELEAATALFQGLVGLTVQAVAWGFLLVRRVDERLSVSFPAHNFFLLGVGRLLWIFRIVGLLWLVRAVLFFTAGSPAG